MLRDLERGARYSALQRIQPPTRFVRSVQRVHMTITFVVDRGDLHRAHWLSTAEAPVPDGAVRLTIDGFALTSNNITYAAFGDSMNYWKFFPTADAGLGCIPVWGFGTVIDSRCTGAAVGERFYGYFPMATDVVLHPVRVQPGGFVDGAVHRRDLHAVYNQYTRCSTDPGYEVRREAEQALLRPLFITSFLIDDLLADNGFFGAKTVVLSSASSKTAYGTAFCLSRRRGSGSGVEVVGLTSAANIDFTKSLGCYDEVIGYEGVELLDAQGSTTYLDFSGNTKLRARVHAHWGDALRYSCSVGGTHWDALGSSQGLAGPRPVLFFAPSQVKKRIGDWGSAGLQEHIGGAWSDFMASVQNIRQPWLQVVRGRGQEAIQAIYAALLSGTVPAKEGHFMIPRG
jgi:hypothetical protein